MKKYLLFAVVAGMTFACSNNDQSTLEEDKAAEMERVKEQKRIQDANVKKESESKH